MKKYILFVLLLITSFSLTAQLKIKKITLANHSEQDRINNMGFDFFNEQLPADHGIDFSGGNFSKEFVEAMHCDNGGIGLEITLDSPGLNRWEWRMGAFYITDKIDAISFNNTMSNDFGDFITFNSSFDEIGIQSAFVAEFPWKFIRYNVGFGAHASHSFNNQLCVFGSDHITADDISFRNVAEIRSDVMADDYAFASTCYGTESHFSAHLFFITGVGFVIKQRVELGLEVYFGPGFRMAGSDNYDATSLGGAQLKISYIL